MRNEFPSSLPPPTRGGGFAMAFFFSHVSKDKKKAGWKRTKEMENNHKRVDVCCVLPSSSPLRGEGKGGGDARLFIALI